ncbi:methylcrotonyl-CoA carboxylase subunit alpha [Anaerolineales bacterium]
MIKRLLIANRGEIASRIIDSCRRMGIESVAVFSEIDEKALHVKKADLAIALGGNSAQESYLDQGKIIQAAITAGAEAIHPGYGFLSENADFAEAVQAAGLIFIGPSVENIRLMGDKGQAKNFLKEIPYLKGYMGDAQDYQTFEEAAAGIGYPIMIKAVAGGGGKGMRRVDAPEHLAEALEAAQREAEQAFGNGHLMLEKFLVDPRHIEVQLFGDAYGSVITLGERECSIQRRHQKIIEEAPSPTLTEALRKQILDSALKIGKQLGYVGAGTVEFLADADQHYYFMEMNTRLQVEHPVTELVTGVDLVEWQIRIAEGERLESVTQAAIDGHIPHQGHAIEVRLYAEDPHNQFLPVTGWIDYWEAAPGVRTDTAIESGTWVSPYYDPMIAKVIGYGENRAFAIRKLDYALAETYLFGIKNNLSFLRAILQEDDFQKAILSTSYLERHLSELLDSKSELATQALMAAYLAKVPIQQQWRNLEFPANVETFVHEGQTFRVALSPTEVEAVYQLEIDGEKSSGKVLLADKGLYQIQVGDVVKEVRVYESEDQIWVHCEGYSRVLSWVNPLAEPTLEGNTRGSLRSPMPGQIVKVVVAIGESVQKGQLLMILEAMKMEHRIEAPYSGIVKELFYGLGDQVRQDEVLINIDEGEVII